MSENFYEADIATLKTLFPQYADNQLGNDMIIAKLSMGESLEFLREPFRFKGYMAIFCLKGSFSMNLNLKKYDVHENSLIFSIPGYIMSLSEMESDKELEFILIALSQEVVSTIRFDFNRLFSESIRILDNPVINLSGDELGIVKDYFSLALKVSFSDITNKEGILTPFISSLLYVVASSWFKKYEKAKEIAKIPKHTARTSLIYENFLRLVTEYHNSERKVSFYADELCLSPKYLSKIVKQVSGKTAPEWIDSFVILEAKNMLRYSNCSIKEIVFKLHFTSQSVFYKFFKNHTGQTPSDYRDREKKPAK